MKRVGATPCVAIRAGVLTNERKASREGENEAEMKKRKTRNICFVDNCIFWGGGSKLYYDLSAHLKSKGYSLFYVLNKDAEFLPKIEPFASKILAISIKKLSYLNLFKLSKLRVFLKMNDIDTVFVQNFADLRFISLPVLLCGIKNVIYSVGVPNIIKHSWYKKFIFKRTVRVIHAVSEAVKRSIIDARIYRGIEKKIKLIYLGIESDNFSAESGNPVYKRTAGELILGNAARLAPDKAQHYLIKTAQNLKQEKIDFKLLIAGTGILDKELKEYALEMGVSDRVLFLGFVKDMSSFYSAIDVFVFSSYNEGFGYTITEAMAHKKPVIAFNSGSPAEIVRDNIDGILVKPYDMYEFANAVITFAKNRKLIEQMGANAAQRVRTTFNLKEMLDEMERLAAAD